MNTTELPRVDALIIAGPAMLAALKEIRRVMLAPGFKCYHPTDEPWAVVDALDAVTAAIRLAERGLK